MNSVFGEYLMVGVTKKRVNILLLNIVRDKFYACSMLVLKIKIFGFSFS